MTTFYTTEPMAAGGKVTLGDAVAHHARVLRLERGEAVRLSDGAGTTAEGTIDRIQKTMVTVDVGEVTAHRPLPAIHLLVPIGDRERMLWAVEKATETGLTSWRPVMYRRSKSVSPRGEGAGFQNKARARAVTALEQSGSPWLPVFHPDAPLERALAASPPGMRLLLDRGGAPLASFELREPVTIALGPEGGLEPAERDQLIAAGFRPLALSPHTLRFETAALIGLGAVRALLV